MRLISSTALAWHLSKPHEFCRRSCLCHPVPPRTEREFLIPVQCVQPSGIASCLPRGIVNLLTLVLFQGTFWYHSHFNNQYCDGLRGAFVIYDPNDPHQSLYDIDNGEEPLGTTVHLAEILLQTIPLSHLRIGTTIFRRTVPRSRGS